MTALPPLIGLGGPLRSGKDAVADLLVEHHGYVKLGMSEPLHDALLALNPHLGHLSPGSPPHYDDRTPVRYADLIARVGYTEAKQNPEVRRLLQALGTEVGRNMIGDDTWVEIAATRIQKLRADGHPVVITGIRFPNELRMVHALGGLSVSVNRPGFTGDGHASETSVTAADFAVVLHNTGTLADLAETVGALETALLGLLGHADVTPDEAFRRQVAVQQPSLAETVAGLAADLPTVRALLGLRDPA